MNAPDKLVSSTFSSWGRYPQVLHQDEITPAWLPQELPHSNGRTLLPVGQGRSYGDSCLNDGGILIKNTQLRRLIHFDSATGVLRAEAGVTLEEILAFSVPRGFFLPVTPGTKYVSIAGAIANDVHGKNHHTKGTIGCFVTQFELLRSSGERLVCSPSSHEDLYRATIGGMGLTGFITWVELTLVPIISPLIDMVSTKFGSIDEFLQISRGTSAKYEFTVAWLDCVSRGDAFGRGIFMAGNFSQEPITQPFSPGKPLLAIPFEVPGIFVRRPSMQLFNFLYYNKQLKKEVRTKVSYEPFFYPLDIVHQWNKLYGKKGFFQFQCVIHEEGFRGLLQNIVESGSASFLAVVKEFGSIASPGIMSFPRPGITLALDFAHKGEETLRLMKRLDAYVREHGGALYPAKDASMDPQSFRQYYPEWERFSQFVDPAFSSSFWRRVVG